MNEIFQSLATNEAQTKEKSKVPIYELSFPELFDY